MLLVIAISVSTDASPPPTTKQAKTERKSDKTQYIRFVAGADYAASVRVFNAQWEAVFVYTPWPHYPYEARPNRRTRTGLIRMYVNTQGTVTSLKLLKSTGHRVLDEEGLKTFIRWRAKPGPPREVDMPLTFTTSN
jgi:TonB family protein